MTIEADRTRVRAFAAKSAGRFQMDSLIVALVFAALVSGLYVLDCFNKDVAPDIVQIVKFFLLGGGVSFASLYAYDYITSDGGSGAIAALTTASAEEVFTGAPTF